MADLQALSDAATPGEWTLCPDLSGCGCGHGTQSIDGRDGNVVIAEFRDLTDPPNESESNNTEPIETRRANAAYIVALVNAHRETLRAATPVVPAEPLTMKGWSLDFDAVDRWLILTDPDGAAAIVAKDVDLEYGGDIAGHWRIASALAASPSPDTDRETKPEVVCLCGSTRFYDAFQEANYDLTMAGKIVLSVGFYPHSKAEHGHGEGVGHDSAEKVALDDLHKRKIDLADRVLVLNVGGYIGSSTRSEIDYAIAHGKPVDYAFGEPAP